MGKQIFLELIKDENIKKINIDSRLVESFKRVMIKIQKYFDKHGYSEKIDFEVIINKYLLPQHIVDREVVRKSEEFIYVLNNYRKSGLTIQMLDDEKALDLYIRSKYKIGLAIEVYTERDLIGSEGSYFDDENLIRIGKNPEELPQEEIDHILCHEFIHFLTSCGKDKLGDIYEEMPVAMNEPLTEMLTCEILGTENQMSYSGYCKLVQYINKLAGVTDYSSFLKRCTDDKYIEFSSIFKGMQNILDRSGYKQKIEYGDIPIEDLKYLARMTTVKLVSRNYRDINDLIDSLINVYSLRFAFPKLDIIELFQKQIISGYLFKNNISHSEQLESRIMQLSKVKNCKMLIADKKCFPVIINNIENLIDEQGCLYYRDMDIMRKISCDSLLPDLALFYITDVLRDELGIANYELKNIDFDLLKNILAIQEATLEKEIDILMCDVNINIPYSDEETVSTLIVGGSVEKSGLSK